MCTLWQRGAENPLRKFPVAMSQGLFLPLVPAEAGPQFFDFNLRPLDSRFRRNAPSFKSNPHG
jgi:hypothetical protein